jgi:OmpA-OmpF porin, OOP family
MPGLTPARMTSVALPGEVSLNVPQGSASYDLARYLESGSATDVPRTFVFDRIQFESGSAQLTPEGRRTVDQLAAILKAYPPVAVRLEGYTDNLGESEANKALAGERAASVKSMLESQGIAADRLSAYGYGADNPIASNATPQGRQKNRRIDLVVTRR